jgi:hypothetical protein
MMMVNAIINGFLARIVVEILSKSVQLLAEVLEKIVADSRISSRKLFGCIAFNESVAQTNDSGHKRQFLLRVLPRLPYFRLFQKFHDF